MVTESRSRRLQAPAPAGKIFTTSELQQGTCGSPVSVAGCTPLNVLRGPWCLHFWQATGLNKGGTTTDARPLGNGCFLFVRKRSDLEYECSGQVA